MGIEEEIKQVEEELRNTEYNKKTERHIGRLKAKLAKLRNELEKKERRGGVGREKGIKKSGNATIVMVGFPNAGKSTILNNLTNADSAVGDYQFTTLYVIPGVMEYMGTKIQIMDMPGIIEGAWKGRGRGKEVLSTVRIADLVLLVLDVHQYHIDTLLREIINTNIRLNEREKNIVMEKKSRGGININSTVLLTQMDETMIEDIMREYGVINASITFREDVNMNEFIDFLCGNRVYIPGIAVLNKMDLVSEHQSQQIIQYLKNKGWKVIPISAKYSKGMEILVKEIYNSLNFIRIYMKPSDREVDYNLPLVLKKGCNIGDVCNALHRDFRKKFRYALVWGKSVRFPGQRVGIEHILMDEDVVNIVLRRKG